MLNEKDKTQGVYGNSTLRNVHTVRSANDNINKILLLERQIRN